MIAIIAAVTMCYGGAPELWKLCIMAAAIRYGGDHALWQRPCAMAATMRYHSFKITAIAPKDIIDAAAMRYHSSKITAISI